MTESSAIAAYFKKIGKLPLLTKEEEHDLAIRAKAGDTKAREKLIEHNLKLVIPVAKRYSKAAPFADLVQEGSIAIITAVDKFDPDAGTKFSTYATPWINQRIGRYVKKHSKNVFVPEHRVNLAIQINKAKRVLAQRGLTNPSDADIAEGLAEMFNVKVDAKTVRETIEFCQAETSLFAKIGDDDTEFGELLEDSAAEDPASGVEREIVNTKLATAIRGLTDLEKIVLELRYGITGRKTAVSDEVLAKRFTTTPGEIRRARSAALAACGHASETKTAAVA